jgi:putative phosphoserine phosphatase/1-acylglycerol-3-phosphate O-acyltransferase
MIHIFDVDDTIIKKTSMWYFLRTALKEHTIKFSQIRRLPVEWIKYKFGVPDMDFIENAVKNLTGIEKSVLEKTAETAFKKMIKKNIYTGAVQLINNLLQQGERIIFATSSIDFVIHPIERFFCTGTDNKNLKIEETLATTLEFIEGKTTGNLVGDSLFGVKKKITVELWLKQKGINPEETYFYSDSYTDIPLLEYCGNPVAVNPDRTLLREAKKRGWKIINFKELSGSKISN